MDSSFPIDPRTPISAVNANPAAYGVEVSCIIIIIIIVDVALLACQTGQVVPHDFLYLV